MRHTAHVKLSTDLAFSCLERLRQEEARREKEQPFEDLVECENDARMSNAPDAAELALQRGRRESLRRDIMYLEAALEG